MINMSLELPLIHERDKGVLFKLMIMVTLYIRCVASDAKCKQTPGRVSSVCLQERLIPSLLKPASLPSDWIHVMVSVLTVFFSVFQISPFPLDLIRAEHQKYDNADIVWAQEEPQNMGYWTYVQPRLVTSVGNNVKIRYNS